MAIYDPDGVCCESLAAVMAMVILWYLLQRLTRGEK